MTTLHAASQRGASKQALQTCAEDAQKKGNEERTQSRFHTACRGLSAQVCPGFRCCSPSSVASNTPQTATWLSLTCLRKSAGPCQAQKLWWGANTPIFAGSTILPHQTGVQMDWLIAEVLHLADLAVGHLPSAGAMLGPERNWLSHCWGACHHWVCILPSPTHNAKLDRISQEHCVEESSKLAFQHGNKWSSALNLWTLMACTLLPILQGNKSDQIQWCVLCYDIWYRIGSCQVLLRRCWNCGQEGSQRCSWPSWQVKTDGLKSWESAAPEAIYRRVVLEYFPLLTSPLSCTSFSKKRLSASIAETRAASACPPSAFKYAARRHGTLHDTMSQRIAGVVRIIH